MANNCNNYLSFEGTKENVEKVLEMFKALIEEQKQTGLGVLPKEVNPDVSKSRYFFDIYFNGDSNVMFWTKWVAPTEALSIIAQKFNVTITNSVEELGCMIYGVETYYADGVVLEQYLESEDFDLIEYNEDGEVIAFKGLPMEAESEYELLEQLLNERYDIN